MGEAVRGGSSCQILACRHAIEDVGKRRRESGLTSNEEGAEGRVYPPSEWIVEIPFDSSEWMRRGELTYGGEPMPSILPRWQEWPLILRVQGGEPLLPVHDSHVAPDSVVSS